MGNSQQKYLSHEEAKALLSQDRWLRVKKQLEKYQIKSIDSDTFDRLVRSRFDQIPKPVVDILFNAITPEGSKRIQIDDFIITLSVVIGSNRPPLMKLLFRVYDFQNLGRIELPRVEKLLTFVSGDSVTELAERKKVFAAVFAKAEFEGALVLREFEQYTDDHSVLSSWIFNIVESLTGPPPASLSKLEQKYSAETVELSLMKKLSLSASAIMRLKQVLQIRCGSNPRSELSLSSWIVLTKPYLSPALAYAVFCAKVRGIKPVWKLVEFAEFCVVFGGDDTPAKAQYLAEVFQTESQRVLKSSSSSRTSRLTMGLMSPKSVRLGPADAASLLADKTHMRRMVRLLAFSNEVTAASTPALSSVNVLSRESVAVALESVVSNLRQSRTSRLSAAPSSVDASGKARFSVSLSRGNVTDYQRPDLHALELKPAATAATGPSMSSHGLPYAWDPYNVPGQILPMDVTRDLLEIEDNTEGASEAPLGAYIKLISSNANLLPALNDLSLMACCVFAVRPSSPNKEKDYIAELFVKRELDTPFRASQPYGPVGTEWMIVSKTWYDNWQKYASLVLPRESIPKKAVKNTVSSPGEIDNKFVLKESEAKILLNGCVIGQQLEVLPPAVYSALASWYGGGPSIPRKVVTLENGASELELYPVHLRVCNCDLKGKTTDGHSDVLFSKSATVRDIVKQLADVSHIDIARVRLWNYASSNLQDQLQLTPEMTVAQAKLQDGQFLLLEICQTDGTWPRSQLGQQKVASPLVPSSTQTTSSEDSDERKSLGGDLVRNDGRVGLDNIGNTCYMNSTLQALVHTEPLAQYFLRGYFATDINTGNVMGHGGKMARLFARLMKELWTVDKDSVSPKKFHSDFTALAEQFSGFDQHDAQELMACILDGLSEDLNLIKSKPYVENPDSDGRPDCELADIWWANHCKRDKSVVQSLFCGQFRSNITCGCGAYSSARFEPFNFLTLPVPEEKDQSVTVFVMPEGSAFVTQCSIRVGKDQTLKHVIQRVSELGLPGVSRDADFLAAEVANSLVLCMCKETALVSTIKNTDNIFLFQTPKPVVVSAPVTGSPALKDAKSRALAKVMQNLDKKVNTLQLTAAPAKVAPKVNTYLRFTTNGKNFRKLVSIQRRIKLSSGGGIEMYRMEAFGLPYVELCDETFTGRDFYERIAKRACPYLNVPGSDANSTSQRSTPYVFNSSSTARDGSLPPPPPAGIVPVSTEAVFAGPLPKYGFVIRTVVGGGGEGGGQVCSRCLWTKGCRGCLVPDDGTLLIDAITDEEVLAVDWHYIVYEEFIDTAVASDVRQHESVSSEEARAQTSVVPFQKCLEKFTEEEKIDGIVCPKCKKDDSMKKAINLWRGPPFLLVQLKRFQFDRFIKRKLVDKVNFPLEDFDISPYYAASRMQAPDAKLLCSQYDLYAIVHHVGRMGEGHYVSTVLLPLNDDATNGASEWVCFNDNAVSVMDVSEITAAPTAYVLLYVRKDVKGKAIEDLITTSKLPSQEGSTTASTATRASITNPRTSTGAATLPAAPPARVSMPAPRRPSAQQSSPAKEVKETARSRDSQSTEAHSDEEREAKKKPQSVETTQKQVIPSQDADVKPEKKSEQSKQTQRQPQRPQQTKKNNKGGCSLQ